MNFLKRIFTSVLILSLFLTMIRPHMSFESALNRKIYNLIDPFLSFFSFYQDWMMFAPNPTSHNYEFYAEIEFMTGDLVKYQFDSPRGLSHWEKYRYGEKLRKYLHDTVANKKNVFVYKDLAKYVLRKIRNSYSDKIPLRVKLVKSKNNINRPEIEFRKIESEVLNYEDEILYVYEVI